jgi:hypothetical protein
MTSNIITIYPQAHPFTGYTLKELWMAWDSQTRPTEAHALVHIMTGMYPGSTPGITHEDRIIAGLRSGQLVICQGECGKALARDKFWRDKRKRNGLRSCCIECERSLTHKRERAKLRAA